MPHTIFRVGDRGPIVAEIRARLARLGLLEGSRHVREEESVRSLMYVSDGGSTEQADPSGWDTTALVSAEYDEEMAEAVRAFQRQRGITVDGIVGPETFRRLEEARWRLGDRVLSYQPGHPFVGDDVLQLQRQLNRMGFDCGKEDAEFGPLTDAGLREFQRNVGTTADGIAGPDTLRALGRLHRTVGQQSAHVARERYALSQLQTGIAGKTVVIDDGPGAMETPPEVLAAVSGIARTAAQALSGAGAVVVRVASHDPAGRPLDELDRASACNRTDADLVLSLHVDGADPQAPPLAAYYFGRSDAVFSAAGKLAAEHIAEALLATADLPCVTDARSWDILRATRMPSVRFCIGVAASPSLLERLGDPQFQQQAGSSVAQGVAAFFAPRSSLAGAQ